MYTREIGDGDGRRIPGVPSYALVPWGSADDCARVWRLAQTREFGFELIEGEVVGYGISRSSETQGGTWVSLSIIIHVHHYHTIPLTARSI